MVQATIHIIEFLNRGFIDYAFNRDLTCYLCSDLELAIRSFIVHIHIQIRI